MRVLTSFSWMCMISTNNSLLSQLTGYRGLGVGSSLVVLKWVLINNMDNNTKYFT
ncbi:hypothetical protein I4U23_018182 [Adineta vaga]|nr:hypothetical protein I4U23_018182 [Adineta vaga]